jgi:hypothetical protein
MELQPVAWTERLPIIGLAFLGFGVAGWHRGGAPLTA